MQQINIQYFATAYGELILGSYQGELCLCDWRYRKMRTQVDQRIKSLLDANYVQDDDAVLTQAKDQLNE